MYCNNRIKRILVCVIANTTHDEMRLCMGGPILENWQTGPNDSESIISILTRTHNRGLSFRRITYNMHRLTRR